MKNFVNPVTNNSPVFYIKQYVQVVKTLYITLKCLPPDMPDAC